MKILLVSDTHGRNGLLQEVMEKERPDFLCHMGDVEGSADFIRSEAKCPVAIVGGNNDFWSDLESELCFELEGFRIFMTHGHEYYVSLGTDRLKKAGEKCGADIVLYGHTHRPTLEEERAIILANPGSLTYPRQNGHQPSYMLLFLEKGKRPEFQTILL